MPLPESFRPEAVVFDLDGTLIDSAGSLHAAAAAMMRELGLPEPDLPTVTGFVGNGVPRLVEHCLAWAGATGRQADGLAVFRQIYDADPVTGVVVFDGARMVLETLVAEGLMIGLCTNKPEAPTRTLLAALDLPRFDAVAGGDTLPHRKPAPEPLWHVLSDLGVSVDRALFVGDSSVDAQTAHAAGVAYVHVPSGYGHGIGPDADVTLSHLSDLIAVVRNIRS
ncbi:phosphoglycolate phosphatase [Jannaschia sp. M317]|uniref:phosphoglycolate phosphatase n=1 Tax=Jannaschia sp. M317 TaxID=2867011 RepID=UPI0021A38F9F|nr:phosphoglycolate phosphatase [Jannaschia sp. M317]UWQ17964.1 phosphoglycolate phosphatase [Jannaschia sp. M317]